MLPSAVREGLKLNLEEISGLRVYDIVPDTIVPPCAIIGQLDLTFDTNNARGLDTANVDVMVVVQRFSERSGQNLLDKLLAGSGESSVKAAIEADRTLGGAVDTLRVTSAQSGVYQSADVEYLSYRYQVTVFGEGA
jgi:hypothetical protein